MLLFSKAHSVRGRVARFVREILICEHYFRAGIATATMTTPPPLPPPLAVPFAACILAGNKVVKHKEQPNSRTGVRVNII